MPDGGKIFILIKEKEIGKISIQIIYEGIGIPKEQIPTLGVMLFPFATLTMLIIKHIYFLRNFKCIARK